MDRLKRREDYYYYFFFRVIMVFIDDLKNSINIFVHSCIAIWLKLFPETSKILIFFKYRIFRQSILQTIFDSPVEFNPSLTRKQFFSWKN